MPDPYANSIRPSICGEWFLQSMCDSDGSYQVNTEITLVLPEKPRNALHGSTGVNLYNGTADITDKGFFCGTIGVTKMSGDDEALESEQEYLRLLPLCDTITLEVLPPADDDTLEMRRLILTNKAEGIRIVFIQ
ncbi:MAG: META domain-containing protein [Spirochaetaceae bacterium]|nr:META domain-containing protein [Spirochaetaceae bacterium]